ncbi:MAG: 16S rRNA (cytosine(1402)-N(4))-methyltransferase, partial [Thermoleophilia bacterium]|nr:16S rRNA (cytosine(1402)-N(4))-methyltransferase [Thermoleophilia bacterium]
DRIVKRRFAAWRGQCTCPPGLPVCSCGAHAKVVALTRKAVKAGREELELNPRAASSRLRAVRAVTSSGDAA